MKNIVNSINICPELTEFSRAFIHAMRTEARRVEGSQRDLTNHVYSDLTYAWCAC